MITRHTIVALLAGLIVVPALAQDSSQPPASAIASAAEPGPAEPSAAGPLRATGAFPIRQARGQWLGSNLIGAKVVSASNETIGHIANLLVDDDGVVDAAVVRIGGIFGIGSKEVAVTYKSLNIQRNTASDGIDHIVLAATKNDLRQAADFKTLRDQKTERTAPRDHGTPVTPVKLTPLP